MSIYLPLLVVVCLMAVSGVALFASLVETRRWRTMIEFRLGLVAARPRSSVRQAASPASQRLLRLDLRVRQLFGLGKERDWGVSARGSVLLLVGFAAGAAMWLLLNAGFHLPAVLALPLALAAFVVAPRAVLAREQSRAERRFLDLLPDAVDMIIRMLRAGLPVTTAIRTVGFEALHPVDTVFATLANQIEIGISFDEALALAGDRIGVADFRFFTAAVALQHSTGGNLAATLETLADIIRRRRAARAKAQAATAEVRLSAIVLGAMPFIVTALLLLLNPGYLTPLVADTRGKSIIAVAIGLLLLGFASMRRMMRNLESL